MPSKPSRRNKKLCESYQYSLFQRQVKKLCKKERERDKKWQKSKEFAQGGFAQPLNDTRNREYTILINTSPFQIYFHNPITATNRQTEFIDFFKKSYRQKLSFIFNSFNSIKFVTLQKYVTSNNNVGNNHPTKMDIALPG